LPAKLQNFLILTIILGRKVAENYKSKAETFNINQFVVFL